MHVSQCMREVCRRLIGNKPGIEQIKEAPDGAAAPYWVQTCLYLMCRIQAHKDEKPGRSPDYAYQAAFAMRAMLQEVAL